LALATVQHNAYTTNIRRSRFESRINFIISVEQRASITKT
jgi:hypothetical protein